MSDFAAVILSKNAANLTACLAALYDNEPTARVIVVDDGLAHRPIGPEYVEGVKPFVFARNANIGIRAAGDVDVVLLNDDAELLTPGGFTALAERATGLLSSAIDGATGNPRQNPDRAGGIRQEKRILPFIAVCIPSETRIILGTLDERFIHYGWEDNDYCRRALNAGLPLGIFDGCIVRHGRLASTFRPGNRAGSVRPNGEIYAEKWSGKLLPEETVFLRANGVAC